MTCSSFENNLLKKLNVSRETFHDLEKFVTILDKWSEKINLISRQDWQAIWLRHVIDCAQLHTHIESFQNNTDKPSLHIGDIGTGAGFPGIILAIIDKKNKYTLIEKNKKKCNFLKYVCGFLKLDHVTICADNIEKTPSLNVDILTSRALASLDKLLFFADLHLDRKGICLFLKGKNYIQELTKAKLCWKITSDIFPSITDPSGYIVKIGAFENAHASSQPGECKP